MSLDETNLHILASSGDHAQREYARKIQPIRKNGHLLLVTLLLNNVLVNETLPIVMDDVLGGRGIMAIVFIVGYPIAKLLDLILGRDHGIIYRRAELKELIMYHGTSTEHGGDLVTDSVKIIRGALDFQDKVAGGAMTPIENAFMISMDCIMDRNTLKKIYLTGHSRIPVYEGSRENILGVLLVKVNSEVYLRNSSEITGPLMLCSLLSIIKSLVMYNPDEDLPLKKFRINAIPKIPAEMPLFDILNIFREGRSHMAVVCRSEDSKPIGIITLEDVLEELIQEEIYDESDKRRQKNKFKSPPLVRCNSEPADVTRSIENCGILKPNDHTGKDLIVFEETVGLLSTTPTEMSNQVRPNGS
ncbi:648_t:CDS:2 [Acaulospora colombiana]|uniref:648_t:CDS:1 n=1 Tax=Acaulospora colombiana TaxID=27376 RepID=A0ACA9M189_9GLOM|nr:648_t:CDS:2 [Acaulospora colombiana]